MSVPSKEVLQHPHWKVGIHTVDCEPHLLRQVFEHIGYSVIEPDAIDQDHDFCVFRVGWNREKQNEIIWNEMKELASKLDKLRSYSTNLPVSFRPGVIYEKIIDGEWRRHHFVEATLAIHTYVEAKATVTSQLNPEDEQARWEKERQEKEQLLVSKTVEHILAMNITPDVDKVLKTMKKKLTPTDMGNIVDIIKQQQGDGFFDFTSKTEYKRFKHSINSPEIFGENARHAVGKKDPPKKPMKEAEAQRYVQTVVDKWIRRLARMGAQ